MRRRSLALPVLLCGVLAAATVLTGPVVAQQVPVFRSVTSTVGVNASVKKGNKVIANLKAADFRLTDNGVPQTIDSVSIESVPIDVSMFLDTSGSTAGKLDDMTRDIHRIIAMLRPGDRFRLLTISDGVDESLGWVPAGTTPNVSFKAVGGISVIHDALIAGLLHRVDSTRRHLVVGMTDRQDCGSVVPSAVLLDVAGRSESVLHLVDYSGGGGEVDYRTRTCSPRARSGGPGIIERAAERTGGGLHPTSMFFRASSILRVFKQIFDEFRQSYMLRYSPTGVPASGWHAIKVTVPAEKEAIVRARQGYYGG